MNLLQMSFCGAVMILVVALMRVAAIDRLPKRTFLVLWGIVMLRLLVPFEVPSEFSVYSLARRDSVKELVDVPVGEYSWFGGVWDVGHTQGNVAWQVMAVDGKSGQQSVDSDNGAVGQNLSETGKGSDRQQLVGNVVMETGQGAASEEYTIMWQPDTSRAGFATTFLSGMWSALRDNIRMALWGIGALFCAVFFVVTYVRCRREFSMSLPVENEFVAQWMEMRLSQRERFFHGFCHKTQVRVSDRVDTPLTYGVFRPVILLPKKLEWEETGQLEYILWHEFMHIYHCDTVMKLLAVFVCCIHWFNPLVWLMYILLNRDVELACDESVVRRKGVSEKSVYANVLINMEAERNRIRPLCSNLSLNAIEKRIRSIMVIRRFSMGAVAIAVGLVMSVTVVFATSAVPEAEKNISTNADITAEEYGMLNVLRFDGYEDMSVAEYRDRVLAATAADEERQLLNRLFSNKNLYEMRNSDEIASYLFYVLRPLTAQRWIETVFKGSILPEDIALPQKEVQGLGYRITMYVQNVNDLSVGEYVDAIRGVTDGLSRTMAGKCEEEYASESYMKTGIQQAVDSLQKEWSTYKLQVDIEFEYESINWQEETHSKKEMEDWKERYTDVLVYYADAGTENSEYLPGTEEDYRKILLLRQPGYRYKEMSVADFDRELLEWSAENYQSYDRIMNDIFREDIQVELSEEEKYFITHTVYLAALSNGRRDYEDPGALEQSIPLSLYFNKKPNASQTMYIWDSMGCHISYYITDKDTVTVGERDQCIGAMMDEVEYLWDEMDAGDVIEMKQGDFQSKVVDLAKKYSTKDITLWSICSSYYLGWGMI